jgi:hypothetical protein
MKAILVLAGCVGAVSSLVGEEVLLHQGPSVSTPALVPASPTGVQGEGKLIEFQREFFIKRDELAALSAESLYHGGKLQVSMVEAIELAQRDIDPDHELQSFAVMEVRLLTGPEKEERKVEYYLVSTNANGSEVHRIVLMNRKILSPRLREIKK